MFRFIKVARGIQILYSYAKEEILEEDFFPLPNDYYKNLPESEQNNKVYTINHEKLNENYFKEKAEFIVNEHEREFLLEAVMFVKQNSTELSQDASFLERLFYIKQIVPACLYSEKAT